MEVSEQRFEGSYDGDDVELRNLIGILPGPSERQVAVMAHRDVLEGSGATSSVAATAALLEIAAGFAGSTHEKTLVFVSTDGGSIGALGARRFASDYSNAEPARRGRGAEPARGRRTQPADGHPLVHGRAQRRDRGCRRRRAPWSPSRSTSRPATRARWRDVFRLAIPSALGEQGPLVEDRFEAVRLSSSGELPPPPAGRRPERHRTPTPWAASAARRCR